MSAQTPFRSGVFCRSLRAFALLGFALFAVLWSRPSEAAELAHVVGKGQWLEVIAKRYHTTTGAIRARNGLSRGKKIRVGQRLRIAITKEHRRWMKAYEKRTGKKAPGRLVRSATAKVLDEKASSRGKKKASRRKKRRPSRSKRPERKKTKQDRRLARKTSKKNKAAKRKPVKKKKKSKRAAAVAAKKLLLSPADKKFRRRPRRRGYVRVVRYGERFRGQLRDKKGRIRRYARKRLSRILRSLRTRKAHPINKRLLGLLARVSDHFGGRTIEVVSGYRPFRPKQFTRNSRHNHGAAIDFRIVGVPNRVLWRYCMSLAKVGCGYYSNSTFVHMDVRDHKTHWIDYSGPGQRPRYAHKLKKKRSALGPRGSSLAKKRRPKAGGKRKKVPGRSSALKGAPKSGRAASTSRSQIAGAKKARASVVLGAAGGRRTLKKDAP